MQPRSHIGEKFSPDKIGTGRKFRSGSFSHSLKGREKKTLAGVMRGLKTSELRRTETANLSRDDLKLFHKLVGDKMKKGLAFSGGLNRFARRDIMMEAERLARQDVISREDKKDLRNIVSALSRQRPTEELAEVPAEVDAGSVEGAGTGVHPTALPELSLAKIGSSKVAGHSARSIGNSVRGDHGRSDGKNSNVGGEEKKSDELDEKFKAVKEQAAHLPDADLE